MDVKQKMMSLWKETFRDSDAYIKLLFDNYFDPELIEYEERGGEIISALLGIPYEFGGKSYRIRGLYLCGLATRHKFRGEGIMSRLLERINLRAKEKGYSFTFLIPESSRLASYYARRGYVDAFYRCENNYTSLHNFKDEFNAMLDEQKGHVADLKRRYFDVIKGGVFDKDSLPEMRREIIELMTILESDQSDMEILHSEKDKEMVIDESLISGGKIYYVSSGQGQISAVAFTTLIDRSRVDIYRMYSADQASCYRLLDFIKHHEPDAGIRLFINPRNSERKKLAKMYGMAHILNLREILKFQACWHGDLKYSILVKGEKSDTVLKFDVNGSKVKERELEVSSEEYDSNRTVISQRDVAGVLFRRPDTGVLITEAFGMPSLGGYINLMFD